MKTNLLSTGEICVRTNVPLSRHTERKTVIISKSWIIVGHEAGATLFNLKCGNTGVVRTERSK